MHKLKKKKKTMLKVTLKFSAFPSEVTRQRHVNNSADARSHGHGQWSLSSHLMNSA